MLKVSPSSLKAFQRCKRSWFLQFVQRVPREVPAYVTAGSALDLAVQHYLTDGAEPAAGSTDAAELAVLKPNLPAPGTVIVQQKFELPCPEFESRVLITTGGLDFMTPPNLDLIVIGDLKRIWHQDAAMSAEQLAQDVQALTYAWFVYNVYNPAEVIFRWVYCVRETRNKETGKVTRKAKSFCVDVKATRAAVDAWFSAIVLPEIRSMLHIIDETPAVPAVEHNPDSCEEGARCFVRHHCPLHVGPVKGETQLVDLSRFRTGARPAINPPAPSPADALISAVSAEAGRVFEAAPVLEVQTVEGSPFASLADLGLEIVPETIPAPPPEALASTPKKRSRRAEKQAPQLDAHEAEIINTPSLESATTEAIMRELRDRGWAVTLVDRSGL